MQALLREDNATYVWLLDSANMTVRRSAIELATVSGNDLVIARGVQPGDRVITAGVHLLKDGQKVKLVESVTESAPAPTPLLKPDSSAPKG